MAQTMDVLDSQTLVLTANIHENVHVHVHVGFLLIHVGISPEVAKII